MMVIDSRATNLDGKHAVRRRRECPDCKLRLTTYEVTSTQDVEDLKYALGRIIGLARHVHDHLSALLAQYNKLLDKE